GESAPRRNGHALFRKRRSLKIGRNFAEKDGQPCGCIHARGLALAGERSIHRSGNVHEQSGASGKLLETSDALEHRFLDRFLELRRIARSRHEAERKRASDSLLKPGGNELRLHARCKHQAKIAKHGHPAKLLFAKQALPGLALVLPCGQGNLPSIGRFERVLNETLPKSSLLGVDGPGVAEKKHVAKFHDSLAVVLRELVSVELRERLSQSALCSGGERLLALRPV